MTHTKRALAAGLLMFSAGLVVFVNGAWSQGSISPESTTPGSTAPGSTTPGSTAPRSSVPDSTTSETTMTPLERRHARMINSLRMSERRIPVLTPAELSPQEVIERPFFYWRFWANQKIPVFRVLGALFVACTVIQLLLSKLIDEASTDYRRRYLRNLGVGTLVNVLACIVVGVLARSGLMQPLAMLTMALLQLLNLAGVTLVAQGLGNTLLQKLQPGKLLSATRLKFIKLWLGVLLLSLVSLVPGFGMDRIGNRLLILIASAGAGALYSCMRTKRSS